MIVNAKLAGFVKRNRYLNIAYILIRDCFAFLKTFSRRDYSQHGEDVFVREYFKDLKNGFFVDIGASHPFRISNTFSLYRMGWNGVAVDPIPAFKLLYKLWRPRDKFLNLGVAPTSGVLKYFELIPSVLSSFDADYVGVLVKNRRAEILKTYDVNVITINQLFEDYIGSRKIDFLTIDVESLDLQILQSLDFRRFRPSLICVEFNNNDDEKKLLSFFQSVNYQVINTIGCNIFASDSNLKTVSVDC